MYSRNVSNQRGASDHYDQYDNGRQQPTKSASGRFSEFLRGETNTIAPRPRIVQDPKPQPSPSGGIRRGESFKEAADRNSHYGTTAEQGYGFPPQEIQNFFGQGSYQEKYTMDPDARPASQYQGRPIKTMPKSADVNRADRDGKTLLWLAADRGNGEECEALLSAGAHPEIADFLKVRLRTSIKHPCQ